MKKVLCSYLIIIVSLNFVLAQGLNHQWLLGNWPTNYDKARMYFDTSNYSLTIEQRKMQFWGTEGNICDANGNFLMSSNGVWIANANNDTILSGGNLNPSSFVTSWIDGLPLINANVFLPFPGDTNKFILFHHTATFNGTYYPTNEILYSIIDMVLDNGLGGVISINNIALIDTFNWGIGACKHANGRDWWVIVQKDSSDIIYKMLLTPNGIESIIFQKLNVPIAWGNVTQLTFSQDGNKFAYKTYIPYTDTNYVLLFDFDRCTGNFSNEKVINITDGFHSWGLAFSPNSNYIYATSTAKVFQINTNSLFVDTVAIYDGFYSIYPPAQTSFMFMYLAANGKMYITSGNSVQHIHEMNYPDSNGISCDLQQHSINLGIWNFRAVPNHPNYYLGPVVGSVCDSLTGMNEHLNEVKNFNVRPIPNNGNFSISYLLPQNKGGIFEVYDVMGNRVFETNLPPWSTLQNIQLPSLSDGVYYGIIRSGYEKLSRKIAVIEDWLH